MKKWKTIFFFFALALNTARSQTNLNVLLIYVDDLRPELNCYGATQMVTPNFDALAAGGYQFNRAYAQQAVCSPSRTSMMTGMRPDSTQVHNLTTDFRDTIPWVITLPQYLMRYNYHSVGLGKIYHGNLNDALSWSEPWSSGSGAYSWVLESNKTLAATGPKFKGPPYENADVPDNTYRDGAIADEAILKLTSLKNQQPFFYGVGFSRPHLPFNAPKTYWDLYTTNDLVLPYRDLPAENASTFAYTEWGELRNYYGMPDTGPVSDEEEAKLIHAYYASVSYVDAQLGRIIDALEAEGLHTNTIIAVWGDHGFHLGNQGQWAKHTNFERATRVPLIFHVPGYSGGAQLDALTEIVDIYPTLLDLCNLPLPCHLQGDSLKPLMQNPALPGDDHALSQFNRSGNRGYSMRTDRYRYTEWRSQSSQIIVERELYDHDLDPGEDTNVVNQAAYAVAVSNLAEKLEARLLELNPISSPNAQQMILNGQFDNGMTDWTTYAHGDATAFFEITPELELHAAITDGANSLYKVLIKQTLTAQSNMLYTIRFKARAATNRDIRILWRNNDNVGGDYFKKDISLVPEMSFYEYRDIQLNNLTGIDANSGIRFQFGANNADIWIDSIEVVALTTLTKAIQEAGLSGQNAIVDSDPDADGIPNILEYAYNLNLVSNDYQVMESGTGLSGLPFFEAIPVGNFHALEFEFLRRRGAYEIQYIPEFRSDLLTGAWSQTGTLENVSNADTYWDRVHTRDPETTENHSRRFGRLNVKFQP